jgi:hypothetical protein
MNRYPLVLPHADVRRILERHATRLVVTARAHRGAYTVQDAFTVRRNERLRKAGRLEEQSDPDVCALQITDVEPIALADVDYRTVRQCGFKTQRDFFDDWLARRRHIDPAQDVWSVGFQIIEQPRFLHKRTFAGYTSDPSLAMFGEPEALGAEDLRHLAGSARARLERERHEELRRQRARNLTVRYREALRLGRDDEARALGVEMTQLAEMALA